MIGRSPTSRRDFVSMSAAAVWIGTDAKGFARAIQAMRSAQHEPDVQFEVLTPEQAADIEAMAAQIIPADDLPGAREARVIVFIDRSLNSHASDQRGPMLAGLAELNAKVGTNGPTVRRFAQLTSDEQITRIREIEQTPFFQQVYFATLVGMFANPSWGGNYEGAGWKVLGFEPRFLWQPPFGVYDAEAHR